MTPEDKTFWKRYLVGCTVLFALIFGGLNWDLNQLKFNPLTGVGLPENQSIDYFRDPSGYHIYYGGHLISLNSTILPNVPIGKCYQLSLIVDVIKKTVTITNLPTDQFLCGFGSPDMGIP